MPLYDYGCPNCKAQKEVQHPMSEIGKIEVVCDTCGVKMKKMLSMPTLLGFDDVGRSVSKKDKNEGSSEGKAKSTIPPKETSKKDAA